MIGMRSCFACGSEGWLPTCQVCGAPLFPTCMAALATVYVLRAECGLHKIGMTTMPMRARFRAISRKAPQRITLERELPEVNWRVETWLHAWFDEDQAQEEAREIGLPNWTEWFYPSLGVVGLANGQLFASGRGKQTLESVVEARA